MGQELIIPDFANSAPDQAFNFLNPQEDSLSDGIGQGYPVIGYKGKTWTLRVRGERHLIVRQDDGTPSPYLDVIILDQADHKSKSYYPSYDQNTDGERPTCASLDGVVPDNDVMQKQSETCALCPRNVWKVDQRGIKTRECSDYKRLAVLILPSVTKAVMGEPLMEPAFLRVPPASLTSLAVMGDTMRGRNWHYASFVTRIEFEPTKAHPQMKFRPIQKLTAAEAPVIAELRKDPTCKRIIGGELSLMQTQVHTLQTGLVDTGLSSTPARVNHQAEASLRTPASAPPATQGTPITLELKANSSTTEKTLNSPTPASAAKTETSAPSGGAELVDTGFGGVATQSATTPASKLSASSGGTSADQGEPEEADADLDARLANLLGSKQAAA